ncbi:tRNA threonylcarbamoyl adenosine modification protein, Sua5/YciO/YrdC/YwlC family [Reichenbachiella faecimaris]|uniref:L-threonylcarbamoyladenylate synthase n=1 Tax=Reichenbachiella faecimaris TaxID=692418 RepID=A0A1W2G7C0_REIFA|nr:L-threonylcarbamoyladenylate synthase [Reichenbachiella faecimaris]SMD32491.1 tRNA threonylcarbamoyl adenosine modification protein, Sua5/YciO/YrdC/YwlC family [Reichenbachiella faecimaris]
MAKIGTDILHAAALLRAGKLVGIPTDTVYGLAGHAQKTETLQEIFLVKKRPQDKPLIAQVDHLEKATGFVKNIPNHARTLAEKYWPGALTLIFEATQEVSPIMMSNGKTIGLRVPDHDMTLELLKQLDFPLAVTSANLSGHPSPTTAEEVNEQIGDSIEYILDGGASLHGLESTIVGFEHKMPVILRKGAISEEEILATLNLKLSH